MACESCIAARQAETAGYLSALAKAKEMAGELQVPIFILKDNDQYLPSTDQQPNTVEVVLPNK